MIKTPEHEKMFNHVYLLSFVKITGG